MAKIQLIYDKQCPACDYYCHLVRIREDLNDKNNNKNSGDKNGDNNNSPDPTAILELVDAREASDVMAEITQRGWDIDQGMVLKVDQELYYGADAIHALALLGSRSGWFNRLNYWAFSSKSGARLLYPLLRSLRNLLLKILGISKINNLNITGNDRF